MGLNSCIDWLARMGWAAPVAPHTESDASDTAYATIGLHICAPRGLLSSMPTIRKNSQSRDKMAEKGCSEGVIEGDCARGDRRRHRARRSGRGEGHQRAEQLTGAGRGQRERAWAVQGALHGQGGSIYALRVCTRPTRPIRSTCDSTLAVEIVVACDPELR